MPAQRVPPQPVIAAAPTVEPAPPPPSLAVPNITVEPPEVTISKAVEAVPPVARPEEQPVIKPPDSQPPANTEAETASKSGSGAVKKGLGKVWHFLRGKKPSDDSASLPAPEQP